MLPILLLSGSVASAQWNVNPNQNNAVCALQSAQGSPSILADDNGGAYIAWTEQRKEDRPVGVYVQHINAQGQILWGGGGIQVALNGALQGGQVLAGDGNGGVIVAWQDYRADENNADLYAQRLSANGTELWTAGGAAVCADRSSQGVPMVVGDGKGGVIVGWADARTNGTDPLLYVQRLDATGIAQWQANGIVTGNLGIISGQWITSDDAGGAIVTWEYNDDIYAQRVSGTGTLQWTAGGVALCTEGNIQYDPHIVSDGAHGAVVAWTDLRHGFFKPALYARRITAAGLPQWAADGVQMHVPARNYRAIANYPQIVADGTGGIIGAWHDGRNGNDDIYAQRLNGSGQTQWTANGIAVCNDASSQYSLALAEDGHGGAVISWDDSRNGATDIYAQQITANGNAVHAINGLAISTAIGSQTEPELAYTGRNGRVIITWSDRRHGFHNPDIYATALAVTSPAAAFSARPSTTDAFNATSIGLAPNPVLNSLEISHVGPGSLIRIVDLHGRVLRSIKATKDSITMDVSDIAPGIYLIRTETESVKFIKQ